MSHQGAPLDVPAHLKDASRERLLAEIGTIRHQAKLQEQSDLHAAIARLEQQVNDLTTQLIHSRDYAMGKAAELGELHLVVADLHQQLKRARNQLKRAHESTTWKIGRLVMTPVRVAKRLLRRG